MTVAKILVPVRGDGKGEAVLEHAIAIARSFDAHVETLYCRAASRDMLPYGVVVPHFLREQIEQSMDSVAEGEEARMHALFDDLAARSGVEVVARDRVPPRDRVSLGWREAEGRQADLLAVHGRLADLIAVPRPDHASNLGFNTLYSALMQTGRPVMMCPDHVPRGPLPGHLAIAWNGSTEAARAIGLGADLVSRADRVTVLTAGATPRAATAEALIEYLAVRGVRAAFRQLKEGGEPGAALLAGAEEVGADLLLMGAYSHSRGRESLFGGVSQHVVDHAELPVVMVH